MAKPSAYTLLAASRKAPASGGNRAAIERFRRSTNRGISLA
ncbi:MAG: hypothetical protein QOH61_2554 [Chloroflexota bacterium]|nr:hypothetical protein [Chloroflexota bacterium]